MSLAIQADMGTDRRSAPVRNCRCGISPISRNCSAVTLARSGLRRRVSQQGKRLTASSAATLMHYDVVKKGDAVELVLVHDSIAGHPETMS